MKKKVISIILMIIMLVLNAGTIMAKDISVYIVDENLKENQVYFDVQPQIINDRTMVPMRAIFEALNYSVTWEQANQTVIAQGSEGTIKMSIGNNNVYKNDKSYYTDVVPQIVNDKTFVPLRILGVLANKGVRWFQDEQSVWLYSNGLDTNYDGSFGVGDAQLSLEGLGYSNFDWVFANGGFSCLATDKDNKSCSLSVNLGTRAVYVYYYDSTYEEYIIDGGSFKI